MKSLKGDEPMYTIKQARMLRGKTQAEMANCLGICRDTYRAIEQNPERATVRQAKAISSFLEIDIEQIFFGQYSTFSGIQAISSS